MTERGTQNLYVFGDPEVDRYRLEIQTQLLEGYVRSHAREFCGEQVGSILDIGCGDGQLGFVLREVYPQAHLVGIDRDEKAIVRARQMAEARGLAGCEFIPADVQEGLPAGQFDLIYASIILLHLVDAHQVLETAVSRLTPGGHIWIKELNPTMLTGNAVAAFAEGSYVKLMRMFSGGMASIGGDPLVATRLPTWLTELGLTVVHTEHEVYTLGGSSDEGQAMLGNILAGLYNARKYMMSAAGESEAEFERLFNLVTEAWKAGDEVSLPIGLNIVAQKPAK